MRRILVVVLVIGSVMLASAGSLLAEQIRLKFMGWGGRQEQEVIRVALSQFESSFPHIKVEYIPTPWSEYDAKLQTMIAGGEPPDVFYGKENSVGRFAEAGTLLDQTPYVSKEYLKNLLKSAEWWYKDKYVATSIAIESIVMWYNRDIFDKAGLDYPPYRMENAWTWSEFVEVAKKLTVDRNGRGPADSKFDPNNIKTFGVHCPKDIWFWTGMVRSNLGRLFNSDYTESYLNQPQVVEVVEKLADLSLVHHVAPLPSQAKAMPSLTTIFRTGQVAMVIGGQWSLLELSQAKINLGIGILPQFAAPMTATTGGPACIPVDTKRPKEAVELAKWITSPESSLPLHQCGLWLPNCKDWLFDPAKREVWQNNDAHRVPTVEHHYYAAVEPLKIADMAPYKFAKAADFYFEAGILDQVWLGKKSAQEILDEFQLKMQKILEGRK